MPSILIGWDGGSWCSDAGRGASIEYLSQYPYNLIGIDNSAEMLDKARQKAGQPRSQYQMAAAGHSGIRG